MKPIFPRTPSLLGALAGVGVLCLALPSTASAADVYMRAQAFDKTMFDGVDVPMWGFALCDVGWTNCELPTAPGPQLELTTADNLTVYLDNTLAVPVSLNIPGQGGAGAPVWFADGLGRARVRSFTEEIPAGTQGIYSWSALRPGTHLYQSGTYPSIEVPMGLYGALVVRPASGLGCALGAPAYDAPDSCYSMDTVLVFSEVDPWMNWAVSQAPGDVASWPSTIDYHPIYFLTNGDAEATLPAGQPGDTALLRMVNAGLETHVPAVVGLDMGLLAQDGFLFPGALRQQASVLLAAGSTLDALVTLPSSDATLSMYDRMPRSNYGHQPGGGLATKLEVGLGGPTDPTPTIYTVDDSYDVTEDTVFVGTSVLANDVGMPFAVANVLTQPEHGTLTFVANGTFTYTPDPDFSGIDGFVYRAYDGTSFYPGYAQLRVSFENDAPVGADDGPYVNTLGNTITVAAPGVLGNDADPDGDALEAVLDVAPASGTLTLNPDGSFTYVGDGSLAVGDEVTFTYVATDGTLVSDPITVTLQVNPVAGIVATVHDPDGTPVTEFRWVVQEDTTFQVDPYAPQHPSQTLSTQFHRSYMPVVAQGSGAAELAEVALDPSKHYYLSVLPYDAANGDATAHDVGGAALPPGTTTVDVVVNPQPVPTAQIMVQIFEDNAPTNGAYDLGEAGLGGYTIILEDASGRYGQAGGIMFTDANGEPLTNALPCFGDSTPPPGVILTCPDGSALIQGLAPGKYGVSATAPAAAEGTWVQTSTIEGTKVIDAWVQAAEPPYAIEFGAPGPHAFIGFVSPERTTVPEDVPAGDRRNTITGAVTMIRDPRPPGPIGAFETGSYDALSYTQAWVGLNSLAGDGPSVATVLAEPDGTFAIEGIPDGLYQLVVWDRYLDQIIAFQTVDLTGSGADLGHVPVNVWFTRLEHNVFLDENQDGIRQEGEAGLPEQNVNIRFRDGTIFQSFPTDLEGFVPFDQVFPFFNWQVAEVDYARFKATGVTVTVDAGGPVDGGPYPGIMYPQEGTPRTETGPVLLEGFQGFPGMTSVMDWGKAPYAPGENGGISGIVYYASTRAENDPRLGVGDPWEPGIPRVKVRLYRQVATDFDGGTSLALVQEVTTDSWDDSLPTGCPGEDPSTAYVTETLGAENLDRCYDGWRNWNQVRPAVFDGGYAFNDIPPGDYVVEVVPPPGYELVKEEDVNVTFGDVFEIAPVALLLPGGGGVLDMLPDQAMIQAARAPEPGLAQPPCVGDVRTVPDFLSLFPDAMEYAGFAGAERPLCDRKAVHLPDQGQAAADFHLFTSTPVAAQFTGLITDDLAVETRPEAAGFGEKWSPAYLPVALRDYRGHTVMRGYSDNYGRYNGVVPSTFTANVPSPSGYSPAMYRVCLNDPGDGPNPDPLVNPSYTDICYTLQFMPGTTSYLDTPVLSAAAFAADFSPPDCAFETATPVISEVVGGAMVSPGGSFTIRSLGNTRVPNPAYQGPQAPAPYNEATVVRDYGFGSSGTVTLGAQQLIVESWGNRNITVRVPAGVAPGDYQLTVNRNGGGSSNLGLTMTVGSELPIRVAAGGSIQAAIDAAPAGSLILVDPGVYQEQLIVWKPLRLQGAGAGSTMINAVKNPAQNFQEWLAKAQDLVDSGAVDLLPGQAGAVDVFGAGLLPTELGAGILVLGAEHAFDDVASRIDGFTVSNADVGGGIVVNSYAHDIEISNNYVTRNAGALHGGIRVGVSGLLPAGPGPFRYNTDVNIHNNAITLNGGSSDLSAGGGVSICTGSDGYRVARNFICGNYTMGDGAGIGHQGLSENGVIEHNRIVFNQAGNPDLSKSGGGIHVSGEPAEPGDISMGSGDITIDGNLIQGNQAVSGHGGGIRAEFINGEDVVASPGQSGDWYRLVITNNMVVNNVAGWSGGGISIQDAVNAAVIHNTIAHNDTTGSAGALIDATTLTGAPQPAGLATNAHSFALQAELPGGGQDFSDPVINHNIIWQNRSFYYDGTLGALVPELAPTVDGQCAAGAVYWDLGVLGSDGQLNPRFSILTTGATGTNRSVDPRFIRPYCNTGRKLDMAGPMSAGAALGEGGNSVDVRYGPLTGAWPATASPWDYHIQNNSPAIDYNPSGPATGVTRDFDNQNRVRRPDVGADEVP